MRLFRSITLLLVLLTAVPVTVAGLILISSTVDIVKTLTWELQQERVTRAGRQAEAYFENLIADLDLLLSNVDLSRLDLTGQQRLLSFILQKRPRINIIGFYDRYGRPLRNLQAFDPAHILPSELARHQQQIAGLDPERVAAGVLAFSPAYTIERPARPALEVPARSEAVVALMIRLQAGGARFVGLELSLEPLQRLVERLRASTRGRLLLLGPEWQQIAHSAGPEADWLERRISPAQMARLLGAPAGSGPVRRVSGARPVRLPGGREALLAFAPLARPDWHIVSIEPLDDAYLASRRMIGQVLWVVGISLLVAVGLGMLFVFGLTRPIAKLVRGSLAIARGKFGTQLEVRARNELGELAHTFNYMSSQLSYYDEQNQALMRSMERGYVETLRALANSIDAKDPYTAGHSDRVTDLAVAIGRELEIDEEQLKKLEYGGILHDIGKIGIREDILGKQGQLTDEERAIMRQHPVLGDKIVEPIDFLQPVRPLLRHHHEWVDGSGYPDGLAGEAIPLGARILAAADTYDAITSDRPYQTAVGPEQAIAIIHQLRGRQLDPEVCAALERVLAKRAGADGAAQREPVERVS